MNDTDEKTVDSYRFFLLMSEISREEPVSQRELSRRLGIALGLVNSYLKNLVAKGYVRIRAFPRNRYGYLLTPRGIAEKSRLACQHFSYFTDLFTVTRQSYRELFRTLQRGGTGRVFFCGVDEVAEIAYLSLKETELELAAILDDQRAGESFFDLEVAPLAGGVEGEGYPIIITSLKRGEQLAAALFSIGIDRKRIFTAEGNLRFSH
jgi:DNA-binding MarR family transcriptional regulator